MLMLALSRFRHTTQRRKHKHKRKRMEIVPFSCACACVVRVNRDNASISTSASTRRLCLRRTGLHVGFLCFCLRGKDTTQLTRPTIENPGFKPFTVKTRRSELQLTLFTAPSTSNTEMSSLRYISLAGG